MILLAMIAAASPVPQPSELKLYKDWTVGCDNGRLCQAVGLIPEDYPEDGATMVLKRGPEANAGPEIRFAVDSDKASGLAADGRKLEVRLLADPEGLRLRPADVPAVLAAMRSAARLELLDSSSK